MPSEKAATRRLVLSAMIVLSCAGPSAAQTTDPIYNAMMAYGARHGMSAQQMVDRSSMDRIGFEEYLSAGQKAGRSLDSMIEQLMAAKDASASQPMVLTTSDVDRIKDAYDKNEMRFVRDFKGRSFQGVMPFQNARQNIIVSGSYQIYFGAGGLIGKVECDTSSPHDIDSIANWDKGETVFIKGTVRDVTFGTVQLDDCKIEKR